jgi:protein-tyrosine phosphatase
MLLRCPGRARRYIDDALEQDLGSLRAEGVGRVVCLLPDEELERLDVGDLFEVLDSLGFIHHHLPIVDGSTPRDDARLLELCAVLEEALSRGETVAIHCQAGLGRTGTVAAALLIVRGLAPSEAVDCIRRARPGSIENESQEAYLHQLAQAVAHRA